MKTLTNLNLPKLWGDLEFCEYDDKLIWKYGRFELYQDSCYGLYLILYDKFTGQCWGLDCDTFDLEISEEIKKVKKVVKDYLYQGKQLKLSLK